MSADTTKKELTSEQHRAIESINKWVAVVASAGSGKTTVLVERCIRLLGGDPTRLDRLLAITFTEKAAAELKTRLRQTLPENSHHHLATAWVGTFHALCARILRTNAPFVGLDPSFSILDENAFHLLAQETIRETFINLLSERDPRAVLLTEELDFHNVTSLLEELILFRWHAKRVITNPPQADENERLIHDAIAHCYTQVENEINSAMQRLGGIDFQELEIKTLELLSKFPAVRDAYQKKFDHILVDEYQDTNDVQSELVFLLAKPKRNTLAIVGDPRQSIYRFRGANVRCFDDAISRIKKAGGEVITLDDNFRSEPSIISFIDDTFENLWTQLGSEVHTPMRAARKEVHGGAAVTTLMFNSPEKPLPMPELRRQEAETLASYIEALVKEERFKYGDITCLFQAMTTVQEYEAAFNRHAIPHRFYGGRGLLERQEIRDLIHVLRYANDPTDAVALIGLLRSPLIGLSDDDCAALAGPDGKNLQSATKSDKRLSLLRLLESSRRDLMPSEILKAAIDATGYEHISAHLDPSGGMQASIDRLITLTQSIEREEPTTLNSMIAFLTRLRERSARLGDPPAAGFGGNSVSCMTVHTAKGLEFPVVILPDLLRLSPRATGPWRFSRQEGIGFKLKDWERPFGDRRETDHFTHIVQTDTLEAEEESKRLLYVAMTRAMDLLVLPMHETEKRKGKWHEWLNPTVKRERNTQRIDAAQTISSHQAAKHIDYQPDIFVIPKAPQRTKQFFTVTELETFERCPHEYYLKYVLTLPTTSVAQSEASELPANIRGSIVHAVIEKYDPARPADLDNIIALECYNASVPLNEKTKERVKKTVLNFISNPISKELSLGRREVRFDWKFRDAIITGSIDWLRPTKDGFDIIDFKTDAIKPHDVKDRAKYYDLQLVTYALATLKMFNEPISSTTLYFLEPNIVDTTPMDEVRIKKGDERLGEIIKSISDMKFDATHGDNCDKCIYHRNEICKGFK